MQGIGKRTGSCADIRLGGRAGEGKAAGKGRQQEWSTAPNLAVNGGGNW